MNVECAITNTSNHEGTIHLHAKVGEEVIGQTVALLVGRTIFLEDFRVLPDFRHQGIGTDLLDTTETLARESGASSIVRIGMFCDTETLGDYIGAVNFFRYHGYSYYAVLLYKYLL